MRRLDRNHLLAYLLLLTLSQTAVAVHKCKGPDGKTVYQDAPCADGGGAKLQIQSNGTSNPNAEADAQRQISALQAGNELAAAIREHRPLVGMTVQQLDEAMGPATKANTDDSSGTFRQQVIYERQNETWYVYTRNGIVDYVQHRPGAPIGTGTQPFAQTKRCPNSKEIENAITAASSIALQPAERDAQWKRIREMQSCR